MYVINIKFFSKEGNRWGYNIVNSTRLVAIATLIPLKELKKVIKKHCYSFRLMVLI